MSADLINQVLKKVNSLPPLPAAVQRLCHLTNDPQCDYDEVTRTVSSDEVLASKILRVANSSFYGLSQRVGTISQALVVIGIAGIKNIAVGVSVIGFSNGKNDSSYLKREDLWRHSLAVSCGASAVAQSFNLEKWEEAFVGGLLHDLGKLIFLDHFNDIYDGVLGKAADGKIPLHQLEYETFGMHHAALGAELCLRWKLPNNLTQMVSSLLFPPKPPPKKESDRMLYALRIADNLARILKLGSDGDPNLTSDFEPIAEFENLSSEQLNQFLLQIPQEVQRSEVFFNLATEKNDAGQSEIPLSVAVVIKESRDAELIRLALTALGYAIATPTEIRNPPATFKGVVADDSLPDDLRQNLMNRSIPILDLPAWLNENATSNVGVRVNIRLLQDWIRSQIKSA